MSPRPTDPLDPFAQRLFDLALQHHQAGRLTEAEPLYRQVLATRADHAESLHLLGLAHHQTGRSEAGAALIRRASALEPQNLTYQLNLGIVLRQSGRHAEAEACYRRVLAVEPDNATALGYLGNALRDQGQFVEAIDTYEQALRLSPGEVATHHNLGVALAAMGRLEAAAASYNRALDLRPGHVEALHDLGLVLARQGKRLEAEACYRRAIEIKPSFAEAFASLADLLVEAGRFEEAIKAFEQALALRPDFPEALNNLGAALHKLHRLDAALAAFDRAVALNPKDARAHNNRGAVLQERGRLQEAVAAFDLALSLDPAQKGSRGESLICKLSLCRWSTFETELATILERLDTEWSGVTPFLLMRALDDPEVQRRAGGLLGQQFAQVRWPGPAAATRRAGPIRLGYFSPDFRDHPTTRLLAKTLESHDRTAFEVTAFSFIDAPGDPYQETIARSVDRFIDVSGQAFDEIATLARRLEIDIAIDLAGYTHAARPAVFAIGAAPIQVNYLGYAGTMGAGFIDYIIADPVLIPPADRGFYTETVASLPHTYQPNGYHDWTLERPTPEQAKRENGLADRGFVFACFNSTAKILPETFGLWMNILSRTPDSVLWLLAASEEAMNNLRREAQGRGVDPSRLVFARSKPFAEHMARYRAADLFLDTLPYNAHTTAADALWMGVPVLTRTGRSFASRVAASLLTAVGLAELITGTGEDYVSLALDLAANPAKLQRLRQVLEENRLAMPLFDTLRYTRDLEAAYRRMHARRMAGLPPEPLELGR